MKIKQLPHGRAFEENFRVTLRGEIEGQAVGWGCNKHEEKWLQDQLKAVVTESIARFYQCRLHGTSLTVKITT